MPMARTHARIPTGQPFNFAPQWSSDGRHLLFVAGEHYNCHPHVVLADGTGLRKLADRAGYRGVVEFLDVPDFHGGSSDIPAWSADGTSVFFTSKIGDNVELFRVALDGQPERLTRTPNGSLHYHPTPSRDGLWLAYGSKRDGVRQLYVMRLSDRSEIPYHSSRQGARGHVAALAALGPSVSRLHSHDDSRSDRHDNRGASRSTISLPILSDAVAAGDGVLPMLITRSFTLMRKSSTKPPSGETACARTPAGAGSRCSAMISGSRR